MDSKTECPPSNLYNSNSRPGHHDFDIREYVDVLLKTGEDDRYFCPLCKGHNLTIEPGTPKYNCWNCGDTKGIAQFLASTNRKPVEPTEFEKIELARLTESIPITESKPLPDGKNEDGKMTQVKQTWYEYDPTKRIERVDFINGKGEKDKRFGGYWSLQNGEWLNKKVGKSPWPAYGLDDVLKICPVGTAPTYIFLVEGEKCVDHVRFHLNVVSVTLRTYNDEHAKELAAALKNTSVKGVIFPYDNDSDGTGKRKALKVKPVLEEEGIQCILIDLKKLYPDLKEKGDIVDLIMYGQEQGWSQDEFIERLEREIHAAHQNREREKIEARRQQLINPGDSKLEVKTTIEETVLTSLFEDGKGRWTTINGSFYLYDSKKGSWALQDETLMKYVVGQHLRSLYKTKTRKQGDQLIQEREYTFATNRGLESALSYCRSTLTAQNEPKSHLIAFNNGTLNVSDGKLYPHDKNNLLTFFIDADYIPNQNCPEIFRKFVCTSFGEDMIPLIRACTKMMLDSTIPFGYCPHLIGESGSGKSVLLQVWASMFGSEYVASLTSFHSLNDPDKCHQNLNNKRLAIWGDMSGHQTKLGGFYDLVQNGLMSFRPLWSNTAYTRNPNIRCAIASAEPLSVENAKGGWNRRIIVIPSKVVPDSEKIDNLTELLNSCKSEIISWAIAQDRQECINLLKNADKLIESVGLRKREAMLHSDPVKLFIDSCIKPLSIPFSSLATTKQVWTSNTDIFNAYKAFCKVSGYNPLAVQRFLSNFKSEVPQELFRDRKSGPGSGPNRGNIPKGYFIQFVDNVFHMDEEEPEGCTCDLNNCDEGGIQELVEYVSAKVTENQMIHNSIHTALENLKQPRSPVKVIGRELSTKEEEAAMIAKSEEKVTPTMPSSTDKNPDEDPSPKSEEVNASAKKCVFSRGGITPKPLVQTLKEGDWILTETYDMQTGKIIETKIPAFVVCTQGDTIYFIKKERTGQQSSVPDIKWHKMTPEECELHGVKYGEHPLLVKVGEGDYMPRSFGRPKN